MPDANIDIGRVITRGVEALAHNLIAFVAVALLLGGLPSLAMAYGLPFAITNFGSPAGMWGNLALIFLVTIIVGNFTTAILVRSTILDLNGGAGDLRGSAATALRLTVPMVLLSFLVAIVIGVGLMLLIVPGIIFALALIVSVPVLIAERPGIIDSMHRSAELTRGSRWRIFLLYLIYIALFAGLTAVLGLAFGAGGDLSEGPVSTAAAIAEAVVAAITTLISSVMTASLYVELRTVKEGATLERLAAVFA